MFDELSLYRTMYRIRRFEETVLDEFKRGVFSGTTHTYLGQEANATAVIRSLQENDIIVTNHRCHGHFLAYGGEMRPLFAELMGKATGVCGGRGGSQHLHWRNFYSNGVQGGIVPIATGMALAEKHKGSRAIAVANPPVSRNSPAMKSMANGSMVVARTSWPMASNRSCVDMLCCIRSRSV